MSSFTIGQMNQLGDSMQEAHYTREDVTKFGQNKDVLRMLLMVLHGKAEIICEDLAVPDPFTPYGFMTEEHQITKFNFRSEIKLYKFQFEDQLVFDTDLLKELKGKPVLNAGHLDYLLGHPELIPNNWKGKRVIFCGTIYRDCNESRQVRYLYWNGSMWSFYHCSLSEGRRDDCFIALAS